MDRWRLLELFLQLIVLPLETIYFIITNSWTQSMLRVILEVAVDLTMNSVLGGASVAVATIMLLRDMGANEPTGNAAAGDATAAGKEEAPTRRTLSAGLRPKMPLLTTTKPLLGSEVNPTSENCVYLEGIRTNESDVRSWVNTSSSEI